MMFDLFFILTTAVVTFVATNIDDIFVLMLFFSQTNQFFRRRHVVLGQYLGFMALLGISLLGFLGSFMVPQAWLGWLGLAPIAIGLHKLWHGRPEEKEAENPAVLLPNHSKIYGVAAVTFANGGDNIGIYTPLFANSSGWQISLMVLIFLLLVAVWCLLGYTITHQPLVKQILDRYGHVVIPLVLITLGILILWENGAFALLGV